MDHPDVDYHVSQWAFAFLFFFLFVAFYVFRCDFLDQLVCLIGKLVVGLEVLLLDRFDLIEGLADLDVDICELRERILDGRRLITSH